MQTALQKAIALILSGDRELGNILLVTAKTSLSSSLIALLLGVPLGIWLGACRFWGRQVLVVLNRTLMGMPPVVCGLILYLLFSGVGPFGKMKLLFTVPIMVLAQVLLITPLVVGNLETYAAGAAPAGDRPGPGPGAGKDLSAAGQRVRLPHLLHLSAGLRPGHCRGGRGVHGGRGHRLEDQCDDHRHHAVHQPGELLSGHRPGAHPHDCLPGGKHPGIPAAKEAEPVKINPCTKTYGGRTVLDFPGLDLEPGRIYAVAE